MAINLCEYSLFLKKNVTRVFDFLFPEYCVGCGKDGTMLCMDCLRGIPSPRNHSENTLSCFDYQNEVIRKALRAFKYKNGRRIGKILGGVLYDKVLPEMGAGGALCNFKNPLVLPIPLSNKRLRERGFNQSEVLVEEMSYRDRGKNLHMETSVLYRMRDTGSQAIIKDRSERIKNVHHCFGVKNKKKIMGRNIILVDDITTTGATLYEAEKALLSAGAKRVVAVTVAH